MLRFHFISSTLLLIALTFPVLAIEQQIDVRAEVDREVEFYLNKPSFVGVVVGVLRDGERHLLAYGEAEKGSGMPPTGDTLYEIGSITKVFTGVILADMVERGLVALDDPVQEYLPEGVKMPIVDDQPIRILRLATHTSGLPRLPDNMPFSDPFNPYKKYTRDLLFEFPGKHQLRRAPGQMEYSNLGMGLLGQLLAIKAGSTYEGLVWERILQPLEMHDTTITLDDDQRRRLAPPYNTFFFRAKNWDLAALEGAGGLRSTCHDMLRFMEANFLEDDRPITKALRGAQTVHHQREDGIDVGLAWHRARALGCTMDKQVVTVPT